MHNDLIVMTFKNETDASKARGALEIMRNSQMLGVSNAVMVTRDKAGEVSVHHQSESPAHVPSPSSQLAGLLADAIFGKHPEDREKKLVDAGLDKRFLRKVSSALDSTSSAILSYIRRDSLVDTQQLMDALSLFEGTLYLTTVPATVEEAILKQAGCD
jgi:uncharacterized membrane protein